MSEPSMCLSYPFCWTHNGQNIIGPDGEKDNEGGEIFLQYNPDFFFPVTLLELAAAIVILSSMAAILGQRSGAIGRRYWIGSAMEVVIFSASWLLLAWLAGPIIAAHVTLPFNVLSYIHDFSKVGVCLMFCGLLVLGDKIRQPGVLWPDVNQ